MLKGPNSDRKSQFSQTLTETLNPREGQSFQLIVQKWMFSSAEPLLCTCKTMIVFNSLVIYTDRKPVENLEKPYGTDYINITTLYLPPSLPLHMSTLF